MNLKGRSNKYKRRQIKQLRISRLGLYWQNIWINTKQNIEIFLKNCTEICIAPFTEIIKYKMSEIEHEEVVNSDDDEDKDSAPVTKIRSYTDIMKMKLDKWVSLDLFMYLLNFNCNWQVDGQAGQASLHPRATEGQRRQQGPGVQPQHNGKVRDREENISPGTLNVSLAALPELALESSICTGRWEGRRPTDKRWESLCCSSTWQRQTQWLSF